MKNSNFTQELVLPSRGLLNPEIPEGKVIQRCMMVTDQKYLAGSNVAATNALHEVIQRTITSPESFDVSKLTTNDTLYLLFKLKILSYGKDYKFRARCPECGKKIDVLVDLSELTVIPLEDDYADKLVVKLPHREDTVYVRVLNNDDSAEINKEIARRKKRNPNDESAYIVRIASAIEKVVFKTAVDGKKEITGMLDIERYVGTLTDLDATTIIDARDSLTYGITPVVDYVCPECHEDIEVSVLFSGDFFRPCTNK